MTGLQRGTRVRYTFTLARIIEPQRRYGIDGYRVQDDPPGDWGATAPYPRWVPADLVVPVDGD